MRMHHFFEAIYTKVKERVNDFLEDTAEAIEDGDQPHLIRNIIISIVTLLGIIGGFALLLGSVYIFRHTLLVWFGVPVLIIAMLASHFEGQRPTDVCKVDRTEVLLLQERAEAVYEFVRDAIFLVLRDVAEYTSVIRPKAPSSIETNVRFYFRDSVAVFQYNALTCDDVDIAQLQKDIQRVLSQKLRAQELPGISAKLVTVEGSTYLPLQILTVTDCGASVNVEVVFANDRSIPLIEAKRRFHLEQIDGSWTRTEAPFDDQF